jgi:indole-3-glycerol phosphate synthase
MNSAAESHFLQAMAESSQSRYEHAESLLNESQLQERIADLQAPTPLLLADKGFDLVAEVKRRSPAEGNLSQQSLEPAEQATQYIAGGAVAISVLTEPDRFSGSLADLTAVAAGAGSVPVMRKDFLVRPYQVREARLAGASGVLLIAAILKPAELEQMLAAAFDLGMFVLLEVFEHADLEIALPVLESAGESRDGERCRYLLGVNCRDLRDLQVNFNHFEAMAAALPANVPWVAESGLKTTEQAGQLAQWGYRLALAGTTLMKSDDPRRAVTELAAAGRALCS